MCPFLAFDGPINILSEMSEIGFGANFAKTSMVISRFRRKCFWRRLDEDKLLSFSQSRAKRPHLSPHPHSFLGGKGRNACNCYWIKTALGRYYGIFFSLFLWVLEKMERKEDGVGGRGRGGYVQETVLSVMFIISYRPDKFFFLLRKFPFTKCQLSFWKRYVWELSQKLLSFYIRTNI